MGLVYVVCVGGGIGGGDGCGDGVCVVVFCID